MTQNAGKRRVVSGIRPSGRLHIGNYLGAVQNWVQLQDEYDAIYEVVDYHGMTTPFEADQLSRQTRDLVIDLLAAGIDPERSLLIIQSLIPEHVELAWILGCVTPLPWLERVPTYKEKSKQFSQNINLGLLAYPVLQAADICIYKGERVPVGEDQLPHLELTREIVRRFNHRFDDIFPEPEAMLNETTARIMSLTEPEKKMSKSLGEASYIAISDEPDSIQEKIAKAVTDTGPSQNGGMSPGVQNLFGLLQQFGPEDVYQSHLDAYDAGELMYSDLKADLTQAMIESLEPIRRRRQQLQKDPAQVRDIIENSTEEARELASRTMKEVRKAVGAGAVSLR